MLFVLHRNGAPRMQRFIQLGWVRNCPILCITLFALSATSTKNRSFIAQKKFKNFSDLSYKKLGFLSSRSSTMASISIPCPKSSTITPQTLRNRKFTQQIVSFSRSKPCFLFGSAKVARLQGPKQSHFTILKAQVHEASIEGSSNSTPISSSKLETLSSDGKGPNVVDSAAHQSALSESTISAFMAEVSDLVKLVDSRDIMELKLKQHDSELIIRKKGAFAQSPHTAPVVMMQPPQQHMLSPHPPMSQPTPATSTPAAPATSTLPSPSKGSKSSLFPLKCPMAGTFYRCPAPGEPPFVKVGDKVQKGQVVCIIEAMKLMNEIEADQSGTVVEILAEDGKAVSVDTPLLIIQP